MDIAILLLILVLIGISYFIVRQNVQLRSELSQKDDVISELLKNEFNQNQALFNIHGSLNIDKPLPRFRDDWSVAPDFGLLVVEEILHNEVEHIIEFGSGLTSILIGYALKKQSKGTLVTFDHEEPYFSKTKSNIADHNLDEFIDIKLAPLTEIKIDDHEGIWYEQKSLSDVQDIELVIVDGPPGHIQSLSRYPALPLVYSKLSASCSIFVDDYHRKDEQEMVDRWLKDFPEFELEVPRTEKGTAILRR